MGQAVFSECAKQALERGKYTEWASELTGKDLQCLLWMVGEFAYRSFGILELLDKHREDLSGAIRGLLALECISRMVDGERFDVDEWAHRIVRRRGHLEFNDLPEFVKTAADKAAPQTQWSFVIMTHDGYVLAGDDAWDKHQHIEAKVTNEGDVIIINKETSG